MVIIGDGFGAVQFFFVFLTVPDGEGAHIVGTDGIDGHSEASGGVYTATG